MRKKCERDVNEMNGKSSHIPYFSFLLILIGLIVPTIDRILLSINMDTVLISVLIVRKALLNSGYL
jgi:hypothetical protein